MTPQTQQSADAIATAQTAIRSAREFQESDAAKWFFGVLRERCDKMADDILHDNELTPDAREALRRERLGILEALKTPSDQEDAQIRVLASYGIKA